MLDVVGSDGLESLHTESARSEAGIGGIGRGGGRVRLTLKTPIAFTGNSTNQTKTDRGLPRSQMSLHRRGVRL
jgi:hypothetical protein